MKLRICCALLLSAVLCGPVLASDLTGAWRAEDGTIVRFAGDEIHMWEGGHLFLKKVLDRGPEPGRITVRHMGRRTGWTLKPEGDLLRVEREGKPLLALRRLDHVPPEVDFKPFHVPPPVELSPGRIKAIEEEMARRVERDQEVRKDPAKHAQAPEVDADNTRWLKALIQEVGWLDRARFAQSTASAALLVKHSGDLALQMAVLPHAENDGLGQSFAMLHDAIKLQSGGKQRYGTQLDKDAEGNPMVLPLEEPDKVDEHRARLGLSPLADYLKLASQHLFDGKPVRLPRADE